MWQWRSGWRCDKPWFQWEGRGADDWSSSWWFSTSWEPVSQEHFGKDAGVDAPDARDRTLLASQDHSHDWISSSTWGTRVWQHNEVSWPSEVSSASHPRDTLRETEPWRSSQDYRAPDTVRLPTEEDRAFIAACNRLSTSTGSAAFGDTIPPGVEDPFPPSADECRKLLAFAQSAASRWPAFGRLTTFRRVTGQTVVDRASDFWRAARSRYLEAISTYLEAISSEVEQQRVLLADMGFFLFEDIVSEAEEEELLEYWGADGMVHTLGSEEPRSRRRFFHYGPVLQRSTQGSVKSTLGIVPASCGAMPAIVVRLGLTARIRQRAAGLGDKLMGFDQLYVNRYEAHVGARIDFHHDNPKTMRQVVAGINLGSVCSLQLRPLDRELRGKTISVSMQRRSLYILSGLCRYHLQHAIPSVTEDRVSLTFRTVNRSCAAPGLWARAWSEVPPDEAVNAHWPLLSPMQDGAEELASDDLNIEG